MIAFFKFLLEISIKLYRDHIKITIFFLIFLLLEFILMKYHQDAYIELFLILTMPEIAIIIMMYTFYKFKFHIKSYIYDEYKAKKDTLKILIIFIGINSTILTIHLAYEIVESILGHGGQHSESHTIEHVGEHTLEPDNEEHKPESVVH